MTDPSRPDPAETSKRRAEEELAFWKRRADEVLRRAHAAEAELDDLREELRVLKEARR